MREVIVNDAADAAGGWAVLYDDGDGAMLTAQSGEAYVWVRLDRAGAAALRDWLDAWLGKEGTDGR